MISQDQARDLIGADLVESDGSKIGRIGQVFLDDQTGQPEWVTVHTGLFGTKESFVPIAQADWTDNNLVVSHTKDSVKGAPSVDVDGGHLSQDEEALLYQHYGLSYGESRSDSGLPEGGVDTTRHDTDRSVDVDRSRETDLDFDGERGVGQDTSGPNTDDAMTRSEERIHTGTEKVQTGKARLRKWVETENVEVTVPVRKEKARLETEPITDANAGDALRGGDLTSEEHEVTLTEERPIVSKETVPVERVRLTTDVVESEETVSAEKRTERIAAEGDVADGETLDLSDSQERDRSTR